MCQGVRTCKGRRCYAEADSRASPALNQAQLVHIECNLDLPGAQYSLSCQNKVHTLIPISDRADARLPGRGVRATRRNHGGAGVPARHSSPVMGEAWLRPYNNRCIHSSFQRGLFSLVLPTDIANVERCRKTGCLELLIHIIWNTVVCFPLTFTIFNL